MVWQQWLTGPQLVGIIFMLTGFVQQKFPPADPQGMYGFRTFKSRESQETFDEGNRYSAVLMMKYGLMAVIIGLVITPFIDRKHEYIKAILTIAFAITSAVMLIVKTDKHLHQMFKD